MNFDYQFDFLNKLNNKKRFKKNYYVVLGIVVLIVLLLGILVFYNNEKFKEYKFVFKEIKRIDFIFSILIDNELVKLKEKSFFENE